MGDLKAPEKLCLDWAPAKTAEALQIIFDQLWKSVDETINWYVSRKNWKRFCARSFRIIAILLAAAAALLPTLGELLAKDGKMMIAAGWTTILLGLAGALVIFDRFFGFSTGWMRYIDSELRLRQMAHEFQMDWEAERANWEGKPPTKEQVAQMIARCKAFVIQTNNLVRQETESWIKEFETAIRQVDESTRAKPAITEPGALNLTVANGDLTADGWQLTIDDGPAEHHSGKTAGRRNLMAGRHEIKIDGIVSGKIVRSEKVVTISAGGICDESMSLT